MLWMRKVHWQKEELQPVTVNSEMLTIEVRVPVSASG